MATILGMVRHGLGRRVDFVSDADQAEFMKILFAGYFAYDIALAITKCSALLFFSRVFPRRQSSSWFNWALYTMHALNCAWLVGILIGTAFICRPVAKNWIPSLPGQCGPPSDLWIGSAVPSAFIDICILLLPLPKVWSLQLSRARRLGIIGVFMLGYWYVQAWKTMALRVGETNWIQRRRRIVRSADHDLFESGRARQGHYLYVKTNIQPYICWFLQPKILT